MQYLLIAVEKPSATRAERSLALERERAIVCDQISEIKNLSRRGSKFSIEEKENLPQQLEREISWYTSSRELCKIKCGFEAMEARALYRGREAW